VDTHEWEWRCSEGHEALSTAGAVLGRCPYIRLGSPCSGTMTRKVAPPQCEGSHHEATPLRKGAKRCVCPICGRRLTITPKSGKVPAHEAKMLEGARS
jgi:hypothetical protein